MDSDPRFAEYKDFQADQHPKEIPELRTSASRIFGILFPYLQPASILDVGCGFGAWLAVAQEMGVEDVRGIDGPWLDRDRLLIDPQRVNILDLEHPFSLDRKFDLVVCIEVAEHLAPASAGQLVQNLTDHGDVILFSAAIPYQGGHHHVNEQFPDYWAAHFAKRGYIPIDLIRAQIWTDPTVAWWLKQNTLLFVRESALASYSRLAKDRPAHQTLSVVHPDFYLSRPPAEHQLSSVMQLLSQPGTYKVSALADGKVSIRRV